MPVDIEARTTPGPCHHAAAGMRTARGGIVIGLINNMPHAALRSTEAQFRGLLQAAAGGQSIELRLSSFPELPRARDGLEHIARCYWPIDALLSEPLDALIVTGTEPRAARLTDEPYWQRFVRLLAWAGEHTVSSIWSCLAAHAAVESLDGIRRQRLGQKRCGVYEHSILSWHPFLCGVTAPLRTPHSRWNDLPVEALRAAGYTILSWSADSGADAFIRQERSLLLFFQGHPEYEDTTLLKEYRRDVGRYLRGEQPCYPTLPHGYFSPTATATLQAFEEQALANRTTELLASFPFDCVAAALQNTWRPAAVAIYRSWLAFLGARKPARAAQAVSTADL